MKCFISLLTLAAALVAGCNDLQGGFDQDVVLVDAASGQPVPQAVLVRAYHRAVDRASARGAPGAREWVTTVDLVPLESGGKYVHPAERQLKPEAFDASPRQQAYYEMAVYAEGYGPRHIDLDDLRSGQIKLTPLEALDSGREILRTGDFIERELLPHTDPDAPHRDRVLRIVLEQLRWLDGRGVDNVGLDARIARIRAALER